MNTTSSCGQLLAQLRFPEPVVGPVVTHFGTRYSIDLANNVHVGVHIVDLLTGDHYGAGEATLFASAFRAGNYHALRYTLDSAMAERLVLAALTDWWVLNDSDHALYKALLERADPSRLLYRAVATRSRSDEPSHLKRTVIRYYDQRERRDGVALQDASLDSLSNTISGLSRLSTYLEDRLGDDVDTWLTFLNLISGEPAATLSRVVDVTLQLAACS
jgi:hypothetical protein